VLGPLERVGGQAVAAATVPVRLAQQLLPDAPEGGAVRHLVDDGTELMGGVVEEGVDLLEDSLGWHRRVWEDDDHDHAQIEVPAIADPSAVRLRQRLARSLARFEGVRWAEVNAITSRVAIAFDGGEATLDALVELIDGIESSFATERGEARPGWDTEERADHPADHEPIHRTIAIMAGDVASLGWSVVGRAARAARVPVEVGGLVSIVDNNPWLRMHAQRLLGRRATALVLPLSSAVANGVAQGPLGSLLDLGLQTATLGELRARVEAWEQREPEFYAVHSDAPIEPPSLDPRPEPLPDGPIESWSRWSGGVGSVLGGATFAATRSGRLATDVLLSSTPKAARLGREGFAALLGRTLAKRGIVPLDGSALRRLDRIDTVVLDADVLVERDLTVLTVVAPDGSAPPERTAAAAERLFDPETPEADVTSRRWRLLPLGDVDAAVRTAARGAAARGKEIRRRGGTPLALLHDETLVAVAEAGRELDPVARKVADAVREVGARLLVADDDGRTARALGADDRVRTGGPLGDDVRALQADGHGVMVVGRQGHRGLAAADVGIGIAANTGRPSWGADLILGRELADVVTLVHAIEVAHAVSRRSARFAAAGSGLAGLVAVTGPRNGAGARALTVINGAAGAAMIAGMWDAVQLSHDPRPRPPDRNHYHARSARRVVRELATDPDRGLTSEEAAQRRTAATDPAAEVSPLEPYLAELANPLNPILGVGAGLSAVTGSMTDASLVLGLIGINAVVGGVQRQRADRAVRSMLVGTTEEVTVLRDGLPTRLPDDELVPGDIVHLVAGDAVPADARIIEVEGLEVDESSLTGESLPVTKTVDPAPDVELADRTSMLYEDTTVVAGSVRAVVVATGNATEVARSLALTGPPPDTGVELRLDELTRRLLPGALGVAAATGGVGLLKRWPLQDVAGTAVSLAIASVPEGLPFVATAGQLAGARRLASAGTVVRNPRTVEALGRVDVLCVDKTGTLTEGRVALRGLSDGHEAAGLDGMDERRCRTLAGAVLASEQPNDERTLQDLDDADRAIHEGADRLGLDAASVFGRFRPIDELPFEASRGVHAVLGDTDEGRVVLVKGAPETVLAACDRWANGRSVDIDDDLRAQLDTHTSDLARRGHRLLAVARTSVDDDHDVVDAEDLQGLELLGLVILADPVRPTAAEAVRGIADAGVRTIMVTGDHPETAASIAEQLGLGEQGGVLIGADLADLDDETLARRLEDVAVVARVTPADKQRIVRVLQDAGHVVAMTGDGANDAAAIRLAQVGVALGDRSSAAARDAADIVVTDDRVETLIDAIAEGRALWGSIREALAVLVGGNLGEIGFTAIASGASTRAPLHPRQFLLVNLFTDLAPAVAIAVRPPDDVTPETLLREGPDRSLGGPLRRDIAVRGTATAMGATAAYTAARLTGTQKHASTVGLAALVGTQLGQTLVAGGWRRPSTILTVAGSAAVFVGAVQTPGVNRFFGSRALGPLGWTQAISASIAATIGSELASAALTRLDRLADGAEPELPGPTDVPQRRRPDAVLDDGPRRVVVTDATSPLGLVVVPALLEAGHEVVALAPAVAATPASWRGRVEVVEGGLDTDRPLRAAAREGDVLLHLGAGDALEDPDLEVQLRSRAATLAQVAADVGVARIVTLAPLVDDGDLLDAPDVLFARTAGVTELRTAPVPVTEVRSGLVLGVRDAAYRLLRGLARLPVHVDHPSLSTRTQPVAVDDLAEVLVAQVSAEGRTPRVVEAGGPEVVTLRDLVECVRSHEGRAPLGRARLRAMPTAALAPALARASGLSTSATRVLLEASTVDTVVGDPAARATVSDVLTTTPEEALQHLWASEAAAARLAG
jgi:cation-transporting ATPase I